MKKIIDYRDPETITEVFKTVNKKLKKELNNIEIIKEAEDDSEDDDKDFFFKNIIFFTNDRDSKSNKTLKKSDQFLL